MKRGMILLLCLALLMPAARVRADEAEAFGMRIDLTAELLDFDAAGVEVTDY